MPELPEVETTRRGIEPHIVGRRVTAVRVRQRRLRLPVPRRLDAELVGQSITDVRRRGKYLLLGTSAGTAIVHLGMSGSLRIAPAARPADAHDHIDIVLEGGRCLRLRDPRRFGLMLWTRRDPLIHPLLSSLGPEPLVPAFTGDYLFETARGRRAPIKHFLMDSHVVVGVGNIYANEALLRAGVHPLRAAGRISLARYQSLAGSIRQVLTEAIEQGGTTLRDFYHGEGEPGYFRMRLAAYGRGGEPCSRCGTPIRHIRQGQRSTFYCVQCQR